MKKKGLKDFVDNSYLKILLILLAIAAFAITLFEVMQEKKVELCYEIVSNTNVLDFNADINKLEVYYDSTNIKQTKENLRIITVRIINKGNKNILKEFYDDNDPIGFRVSSGKIIEKPEIIQTSSDYLTRNTKINLYLKEKVTFSKVILESDEFFIIKLLVLHKSDTIPNLLSFGKIASQKEIEVISVIDTKKELSFIGKVFVGNIWVQLVRILIYIIALLGCIILIIALSEAIDSKRSKWRRRKTIEEFKDLESYEHTKTDEVIFNIYMQHGASDLVEIDSLLKNEDKLNDINKSIRYSYTKKGFNESLNSDNNENMNFMAMNKYMIEVMINNGIVFKERNKLGINISMKDTLRKFVEFLRKEGKVPSIKHIPRAVIRKL